MSETLNTTLERGHTDTPESNTGTSGNSPVAEQLGVSDEELNALAAALGNALEIVNANADKLVVCERLGGVEMTLGQAVNAIWPPSAAGAMLLEGIPSVVAEIQKMLNSRAEEQDESEDEEEAAEQNIESEVKQENDKPEKKEEPAKKEVRQAKIQKEPAAPPESESNIQNDTAKLPDQPINTAAEMAYPPDNAPANSGEAAVVHISADVRVVPVTKDGKEEINIQASASTANLAPTVLRETNQEPDVPTFQLPDQETIPASTDELENSKDGTTFDVPPELDIPAADPDTIYNISPTEIVEHASEPNDEIAVWHSDDELILSEPMAILEPEQSNGITLPVDEIADTLRDLDAVSEPGLIENVNQILDQIKDLAEPPEFAIGGITEDQIQEELEELFIELLTAAGAEYTPELIESLVRMTLHHYLKEEYINFVDEESSDDEPQDIGTHEVIKQLLAGLNSAAMPAEPAYVLGKSAVQLCIA